MNICWSGLLNLLRIGSYFSNETQEALFASSFFMQLFGPGLLVPIAEELIFRGLLYARMRTRLQAGPAIVISALLFALYHGNPIQMIYAFPMAVVLALLYERGGNLIYPILFHMGANLTAILIA
ncbi:MAG: CPBP family intramembrane metalloprotease [Lachnospiraceae bacterium]|nr:CPBP family intramembrane metalloprotease [Lachnospiraceae bacterium]